MTVSASARLGLTRWSAGTDPFSRAQLDGDHAKLDDLVLISAQGTLAGRPAFGTRGRLYFATDNGRLYYDTGTAWVEVVVPGVAHTFTAGQSIIGTNAPGAGSGAGMTGLRLASASPTLELHDTDAAAGAAGARYWLHVNSGSFHVLIDRDNNGTWESPHPFRIETAGIHHAVRTFLLTYRETTVAHADVAAGGTLTVDPGAGTVHAAAIAGNITVAVAGMTTGDSLLLRLYMGAAYAVTWPTGLRWAGKTAPTLEVGNNVVSLWSEGGILWGSSVGVFS